MKVFLTGTSGLLGSNIAQKLMERGYVVKALFRVHEQVPQVKNPALFEPFFGDITDADKMEQGIQGCDVVMHAAADTSQWPDRSPAYVATNVDGTRYIVDACKKAGVKRMIYVSTANTVGFGTKEEPGHEQLPPKFKQYGLGYMETKYLAQQMILREVKAHNFPAIIVNPTFMIGPGDAKPSSGKMVLAIYEGKVPGYPSGGKNYVYVGDVATAMVNAIEMGRIGECYILGGTNLSYREMFTLTAKIVGRKPPRIPIPGALTKGFGLLSSLVAWLSGKAPNVSYKMARVSCDGHYFSPQKAIQELKMPQTPIDVAIQECFEWFKANGYIKN
jgi:dihydroflavonol-4-reductase